jgi:hypothetical protein
MRYSSRFFLYAPITAFLALALWAMAYWWMTADAVEKTLDRINGHEAMPGITISYGARSLSGFPFNIDVVFSDFAIRGRGAHGPFAWHSERFALHRLILGRPQDIYEAAGKQSLSFTSADGGNHRLDFLPGSLRASALLDSKGLARFDLQAIAAAGDSLRAADLQLHLRRDPDQDGIDLYASGNGLSGGALPGHFVVSAELLHAASLRRLLAGQSSWPDAAAQWKAQGGVAKILSGRPEDAALLNPLY